VRHFGMAMFSASVGLFEPIPVGVHLMVKFHDTRISPLGELTLEQHLVARICGSDPPASSRQLLF
jgi:hypothetical protein